MTNADVGILGEDFATEYYTKHGYELVFRNYHSRYGEIDVIVKNEECIAFVEVKTRSTYLFAPGREAVDTNKQKKIILTAMQYLQENDVQLQPRFDVFEVMQKDGIVNKFHLIKNAFDLTDFGADYGLF